MNFEEFMDFNKNISSEPFYSILAILHERLPCSSNVFRLKSINRKKLSNPSESSGGLSPCSVIASPGFVNQTQNHVANKFLSC